MRIAIVAPGSRGDIQPNIALGKGLQSAGHGVRIVTDLEFEPLVRSYGLDCRPVAIGVQDAFQEDKTRAAIEGGKLLASFAKLADIARRASRTFAELGLEACREVDGILAGFGGLLIGYSLAEKLGLPLIQAYNVPLTPTGLPHLAPGRRGEGAVVYNVYTMGSLFYRQLRPDRAEAASSETTWPNAGALLTPTSAFPGALVPVPPFVPAGLGNRPSHRATRQILWQAARLAGAQARRVVLGPLRLPSGDLSAVSS